MTFPSTYLVDHSAQPISLPCLAMATSVKGEFYFIYTVDRRSGLGIYPLVIWRLLATAAYMGAMGHAPDFFGVSGFLRLFLVLLGGEDSR